MNRAGLLEGSTLELRMNEEKLSTITKRALNFAYGGGSVCRLPVPQIVSVFGDYVAITRGRFAGRSAAGDCVGSDMSCEISSWPAAPVSARIGQYAPESDYVAITWREYCPFRGGVIRAKSLKKWWTH